MPCKNCSCDKCLSYFNQYCPFCDHHIKYHQKGKCAQPTCRCQMRPFIKWKKEEEINDNSKLEDETKIKEKELSK